MDKSFVNIDDLVRQRLSGGEEQERAGSWMRMRELLDKEEDDKKPVGFIYWRRMLGAMAVLLTLATITVGSYEYTAFRNGGAGKGNDGLVAGNAGKHAAGTTAPAAVNRATAANSAIAANTSAANSNTSGNNAGNTANGNTTADNTLTEGVATTAHHSAAARHSSVHHSSNTTHNNNNNSTAHNATTTISNNNNSNNDQSDGKALAATKSNSKSAINNKTEDRLLASNMDKAAAVSMAEGKATGNTTSSTKVDQLALSSGTPTTAHNNLPATSVTRTANTSDEPAIANTDVAATSLKKDAHKPVKVAKAKQAKAHTTTSTVANEKAAKAAATNNKEIAAVTNESNARANEAKASKGNKTATSAATTTTDKKVADNTKVSVDKTSSSVATTATEKKNIKAAAKHTNIAASTDAAGKVASNDKAAHKAATTGSAKAATAATTGAEKVAAKKAAHKAAAATTIAATTKTAVADNADDNDNEDADASTQHTTVNKLALSSSASNAKASGISAKAGKSNAKAAKTTADKATAKNNTYSSSVATAAKAPKKAAATQPAKPTVTAEDADMDKDANKAIAKNKTAKKGRRTIEKIVTLERYTKTSSTSGYFHLDTVSTETVSEEYDMAEYCAQAPMVMPKSGAAGAVAKKLASSNDNSGTMKKTLDNTPLKDLATAFNDMKYKVGAVQFAPGVTAGINGTFFGPSSFKGFQFGVTGTLALQDNLSINGELKYFHRINNEYQLNDNFYTYTPAAGGYKKELELNWYSFSTLHSFELPLYVAYGAGNFSLFGGPNFVYTMAINTGAAQLKDPNYVSATYTTVGNDNTPKLNSDDFGTRFGIGYLVGISYRMAPNMNLDFRTVQTMWDNARSVGSKTVSSELYKSPSLQVSFGYRLGKK